MLEIEGHVKRASQAFGTEIDTVTARSVQIGTRLYFTEGGVVTFAFYISLCTEDVIKAEIDFGTQCYFGSYKPFNAGATRHTQVKITAK